MSEGQRIGLWAAAGLALIVLIHLLTPILTPFVVGAGLAYLGDPLVDRMQRWGLSRTAGVSIVFVVIAIVGLVAALLVLPLLYHQGLVLLRSVPDWLHWLQDVGLPKLGITLPEGVRLDAEGLKQMVTTHWSKAGGFAAAAWDSVSQSGAALLTAAANLLMIPIVAFYLLRDWDALVASIRKLVPRRWLATVSALAGEADQVLAAFIRGQLSVMAALAVIYSLGLWIAGVDLALLIGLLAGLVSFVPYLGFIVGILAAGLAVLIQTHELLPLVWIVLVFGIGQMLESMWLTPWLVGNQIGLHPVMVIFAILAGGQLFGFVGVLLALPAAAVLAVLARHAFSHWLRSRLYLEEVAPASLPVDASASEPGAGQIP